MRLISRSEEDATLTATDESKIRQLDLTTPWVWHRPGGELMLTTDGGGMLVILAAQHKRAIMTRDPKTGLLRPIREDDAVARMIAAAPKMLAALRGALIFMETVPPSDEMSAELRTALKGRWKAVQAAILEADGK